MLLEWRRKQGDACFSTVHNAKSMIEGRSFVGSILYGLGKIMLPTYLVLPMNAPVLEKVGAWREIIMFYSLDSPKKD